MKKIFFIILVLISATSCKKFLDRTPPDKLTEAQAFSTENTLQLYINSFYQTMLPTGNAIFEGDVMADITVPNNVPAYISGKTTAVNAGGWGWGSLRNINYFLENYNMNPDIPEARRAHFGGIARFFRAYFYYNMVKQYGDVPWYSTAMSVDDEALYKARDPRTQVMDSVLADLNFACNNISDVKNTTSTQVTKWVALAYKSRICLFEGTFRKYHTELNLMASANQWLEEAASAAQLLMESGQYAIYNTGKPQSDYRSLFISENPVTTEVLLAAVYNNALKKWHNAAWWFNSATLGARLGLNKTFVNTYLNIDGTSFTDLPGYETIEFQDEVKNRDHRLQQTIRAGDYKRTDGSPAPPDFTVTYSGYQIQKFSLDDKYHDTRTESYNSIPIFRYAEVLLNYAEARAELGTLTTDDWDKTIKVLRTRAGIQATAMPLVADTYMQTEFFPAISDAALLEIRRERGIELAVEGIRYDDLKRWKAAKLLEKDYVGLYVPAKGQLLDLNEDGIYEVSFVDAVPPTKVPGVVYFVLNNTTSKLSNGNSGNLLWLTNVPKSFEEKQYYYPIPLNETILNPNLEQNPGWE